MVGVLLKGSDYLLSSCFGDGLALGYGCDEQVGYQLHDMVCERPGILLLMQVLQDIRRPGLRLGQELANVGTLITDGLQPIPRSVAHLPPAGLQIDLDLSHKSSNSG